ncbi:hypothetical protein SKAU_G00194170 [Synaphobranchus kaupii]|uniref:HTH psq-type domain-containing protein n=1 Tax=Synaphobranchus kaupii TaxID=118154 RepID=A0A9Q1FEL0_SYNKA|nr:hypothetical protein SKAU_G00194170 [Synaphobranchus kaupii]
MLRAAEACKEGMSVGQAVRLYKVPRSTLADRVNGRVTHGAVSGPGQLLSKSLVRYCQYMASHGHPLTKNQCSAFGTSIRRERDPNAQPLSCTWWRNFRQRHHVDLTMRTPEIIDRGRAMVITGEEFQRLVREREEKEQAAAALKEQRAQLRRRKMEQLAQRQRAAVAAASSSTAAGPRTTSRTVARPPHSRGTPCSPQPP